MSGRATYGRISCDDLQIPDVQRAVRGDHRPRGEPGDELGDRALRGHRGGLVDEASGRPRDMFPLYFDDYPKVAQVRRLQDAGGSSRCAARCAPCASGRGTGLKCAFHMYEPTLPHVFEREYPELVSVLKRPTQAGTQDIHSHMDPDNPETWKLVRCKYAELAREFPLNEDGHPHQWTAPAAAGASPMRRCPFARRIVRMVEEATAGVRSVRKDVVVCLRLWGRNWPARAYRERNAMINAITGITTPTRSWSRRCGPTTTRRHPAAVFKELAGDVPVMYKSTPFDICDAQR